MAVLSPHEHTLCRALRKMLSHPPSTCLPVSHDTIESSTSPGRSLGWETIKLRRAQVQRVKLALLHSCYEKAGRAQGLYHTHLHTALEAAWLRLILLRYTHQAGVQAIVSPKVLHLGKAHGS